MRASGPAADRLPIVVGWALGLACFAYLLALPPTLNLADESFILYGAKRIYQGQALYRDFFEFLNPGSFYLYALTYAVGGVSITSARVATALLNGLSAVCVYFLALRVAGIGEAVIAGLLVVAICVPVWNMASHHWIATAFGLAMAAVLLAPRWRESSRARPATAGALAGLLVSTHQSRGVLLALWLVAAIPLVSWYSPGDGGRWRRWLRELGWTAAGGAAVCVPIFGYAVWRASLSDLVYATHTWVLDNYGNYNVGVSPWAGYGSFWAGSVDYTYHWLMRLVPVLLAFEAAWLLWALWREGLAAQRMRVAVFLLALAAVGGIAYFPDIVHVAFVLPFALVVIAGMVHRLRTAFAWIERPAARGVLRLGWVAVLAVVLVKSWANARLAWSQNPVLFETAFGTLAGPDAVAGTIRELRETLDVDPEKPPRLFAHSTEAWIYLALPADNPTRYALLRPVYNTREQIAEAIETLERDPEVLVLVNPVTIKPDDPVVARLRESWHETARLGPRILMDAPLYRLYRRGPSH